nr:putative ribonuclease H-like domain-containing protein [Tanacetum cinerariifolium]
MGQLTFFLGLQVDQRSDGIFIHQTKYVNEILYKFDMDTNKSAPTPFEPPKIKDKNLPDGPYRSLISSLMYLTASRPDITFVVSACARNQVSPTVSNLNAMKRIFKYIKGHPNLGLWYPRDSPFNLEAFSDSDYAGAAGDRKSTTGGCQFMGRRLISWQCKKQTIVATSSCEAEYVPATSCCGQRSLSTEFEQLMHKRLQMSSMGELTFFLGLHAKQRKDGIFLTQDKYVSDILKKFGFSSVKLASTPIETHKPLSKDAVKRTFRYLKGQPTLGLWYLKDSPLDMIAYFDSDYAGASLDRKSTTGGCQFLGSRLISWQCKKQTIVANSTTKAEYITKIHVDNESAIYVVKNYVYHSKTKHIEIRHHFIRDSYEKRLIEIVKIHTDYNVADLLTKVFDVTSAKTTSRNKFSSTMAFAIICLATNQKFNFSRYILLSLVKNIKVGVPFFMFPSGEDSLKLKELMDFCTNLSNKVLDFESKVIDIKSTYQARIEKLESRIERLEEENRVLKELKSVHSTVDSDEPIMEKDKSSKRERKIADIDVDEPANVEEVLEVVKAAKLITKVGTTAGVDRRGVIIQDHEETTTVTMQPKVQAKDKGKAIMIKEPKPLKRQAQIELDEEVARQLEAELNVDINWNAVIKQVKRSERLTDANMAGYKMDYFKGMSYDDIIPLFEKHYNYNQAFLNKVNEGVKVPEKEMEQETEELKKSLQIVPDDDDDVYTYAPPLASKISIIDYKIHTERNRPYFKIIRADGNHMLFLSFNTMLTNFNREDLESL